VVNEAVWLAGSDILSRNGKRQESINRPSIASRRRACDDDLDVLFAPRWGKRQQVAFPGKVIHDAARCFLHRGATDGDVIAAPSPLASSAARWGCISASTWMSPAAPPSCSCKRRSLLWRWQSVRCAGRQGESWRMCMWIEGGAHNNRFGEPTDFDLAEDSLTLYRQTKSGSSSNPL